MRYAILLAPEALEDLKGLDARLRATVRNALETHLRFEPTRVSKSRIRRLRGIARPQFRLRVGGIRVFYDVVESRVEVLSIVSKSDAEEWLKRAGEGK